MSLIPVEEATRRLLAGIEPLEAETVPIGEAAGRVLATDLAARRTQPPFPASAMDGYAVQAADTASSEQRLELIGESRAGLRFGGELRAGQTVRIFTGAPVPPGADAVLIQENAARDGNTVRALEPVAAGRNVRPAGLDFNASDVLLKAGRLVDAGALALAAAMGFGQLPVRQRPRVAILATGDELVPPGTEPGPDQIVSSNSVGIAALVAAAGGAPVDFGIAPDDRDALRTAIERTAGSDILVVIGGASVGDHDLVQGVLTAMGMQLDFWRIAMRPGKPLMVGRLNGMRVLGLPGNPVSSLVCSTLFLQPLILTMLGRPAALETMMVPLASALPQNDERQDYIRARMNAKTGDRIVDPFGRQDSSMLSVLASANALIVRPPHARPAAAGELVHVLKLS